MKQFKILIASLLIFLTGCQTNQSNSSITSNDVDHRTTLTGEAYDLYTQSYESRSSMDSYALKVNSTYTMSYSDETMDVFILDGILQGEDCRTDNPTAKIQLAINSNGGNFSLYGNYYDGTLYSNYNDVTYYEQMSYSDLVKTLVIPVEPTIFQISQISSITAENDANNNQIYTLVLNQDDAKSIFSDRYDSYGLNVYNGYEIQSNQIEMIYDENGNFISEIANFQIGITVQDQQVHIQYESTIKYENINDTEVRISDQEKQEEVSYVAFEDIDTSLIETETTDDDSEEDSVVETFKKRLFNRMSYEINEDGIYVITFNDTETYQIDFENNVFSYTNYSIRYSYNWRGDVGTMSACTLEFETGRQASSCEETTIDMIRKVKSYFEMELYYCGLSLTQLQNETK